MATAAFVVPLAGILRHRFGFAEPAFGAGDGGFQYDFLGHVFTIYLTRKWSNAG
jgi:hypothetical protein